jgi:hypothetical protein
MNSAPVVTYNGTEHAVIKMACGYVWKLVSVSNKRDSITMNFDQMVKAGFAALCGVTK